MKAKDPAKVEAGRKGGKASGGNFKHDRDRAAKAGRLSAWKRSSQRLQDFPLELEDMAIKVPKGMRRQVRKARI